MAEVIPTQTTFLLSTMWTHHRRRWDHFLFAQYAWVLPAVPARFPSTRSATGSPLTGRGTFADLTRPLPVEFDGADLP